MATTKQKKKPVEKKDDTFGEIFFHWRFPEFNQYNRSRSWYIGATAIVVLLEIYAVWTMNFLFGLIVIISWLIILMFHRAQNEVEIKITEDGVVINSKLFEYKTLQHFYIIYEPPEVKMLYFEPKSFFVPRIPASLEQQDPVKIREILKRFLDEDIDRENEPTSEQFSRLLKL